MTLDTHHPFAVPVQNPEITALQKDPDGYAAALRYLDRELQRFFTELLDAGLPENTMVVIAGERCVFGLPYKHIPITLLSHAGPHLQATGHAMLNSASDSP